MIQNKDLCKESNNFSVFTQFVDLICITLFKKNNICSRIKCLKGDASFKWAFMTYQVLISAF